MAKLWDFLLSRIKKAENTKSDLPFLHESIDLKAYPITEYKEWLETDSLESLRVIVAESYQDFLITSQTTQGLVSYMSTPTSSGLVIHLGNTDYDRSDGMHFLYHTHTTIKAKGYVVQLADVKSRQKASWIENSYRYYLKPSIKLPRKVEGHTQKIDQLYGNISLEFTLRDDRPYQLRLIANNYHDQNYAAALDFSGLIDVISKD